MIEINRVIDRAKKAIRTLETREANRVSDDLVGSDNAAGLPCLSCSTFLVLFQFILFLL